MIAIIVLFRFKILGILITLKEDKVRKIEELYRVTGQTLDYLDMDRITPEEVFTHKTNISGKLNTKYMAKVLDMEKDDYIFVDLSLMGVLTQLVDDALLKLAECDEDWEPDDPLPDMKDLTWDIVGECITDKLVMGYCYTLPEWKDAKRSIRTCQVLHTDDFEMSYCLLNTPEDRNVKFRRWQLLDMAITKMNEKNPIELDKCLLSVNGCLSRPIMFKGELLMAKGAQWIHNNTLMKLPSVTLLDFTNLNGFTCVPFSDCKYQVRTGRTTTSDKIYNSPIVPGREIEIFLPENISLKNKTVWMVLGHSLYFSNNLLVSSDSSIILNPYSLSLDTALLKAGYHAYNYFRDTNVFHTECGLTDYINLEMWKESHMGAFFIMINTPHLYIRKTNAKQYAKERMHVAVPDTQGFLWDERSRSIFDHTRAPYRTYTDFYAMPQDRYCRATVHDWEGLHIGAERIHPWYQQWLDVNEVDMSVVEVITA